MKKHIIALALLCSSIATFGMSKPASAQLSQSSIGPSVEFGNGQTVFGVDSKFGISVRQWHRATRKFGQCQPQNLRCLKTIAGQRRRFCQTRADCRLYGQFKPSRAIAPVQGQHGCCSGEFE